MYEKLIEALREEANNFAERFRSPIGGTDAKLIDIADALANVAYRLERGGDPKMATTAMGSRTFRKFRPVVPGESAEQGKAARFIVQGGKAGREYSVPVTTNDLNGTTQVVDLDDDELPLLGDSCETTAPSFYTVSDGYITKPTAPPVIAGHSDVDALDIRFSVSRAAPGPANDDDEPLDAEWLRGVGFRDDGYGNMKCECRCGSIVLRATKWGPAWSFGNDAGHIPIAAPASPADIEAAIRLLGGVEE